MNIYVFRMKTKCLELETMNEGCRNRYAQLDEDRADIIDYLTRVIEMRRVEAVELKEHMETLQKVNLLVIVFHEMLNNQCSNIKYHD